MAGIFLVDTVVHHNPRSPRVAARIGHRRRPPGRIVAPFRRDRHLCHFRRHEVTPSGLNLIAAIPAPGEAVWLPEGEAPHDQANTCSRRVPRVSSALVPPLVSRSDAEAADRCFDRIERAFAAASGHEAMIRALDDRIADYVNEGWSFDCSYVWAVPVNPGDLVNSAIEIRISEWDLVNILTAEDDGYDEHAYDGQKVAHNRSWDALDLENTFEHRRENGLIRRKTVNRSWEYEDTKFSDPESMKFDTDDLIDAAVEVYLNPRKSSSTIRDPRQFELTLEALRRRAGIAQVGPLSNCYRTTRLYRQLTASSRRSSPQNNSPPTANLGEPKMTSSRAQSVSESQSC
jgi:hypothetical protein